MLTTHDVASNCDAASAITGAGALREEVSFSPSRLVITTGSAFSDPAGGTVERGGSAAVVVVDKNDPAIALYIPVTIAT